MPDDTDLFLVPAGPRSVKAASGLLRPGYSWMYLGSNIQTDAAVQRILPLGGRRILIADDIREYSRKYREEYIQAVGRLMRDPDDRFWWASRVSEKNLNVSGILLNFCFIASCIAHAETEGGQILVVCESRGVAESLLANFAARGLKARYVGGNPLPAIFGQAAGVVSGLCRVVWFAVQYSLRTLAARLFPLAAGRQDVLADPTHPWVVLHKLTDARSFIRPGSCRDVYFGDLGSRLRKAGVSVCYLVDVLPTYSYLRSMRQLARVKHPCIYLEEFITPLDVFSAAFLFRRPALCNPQEFSIGTISLAHVLEEDLQKGFFDIRSRQALLCRAAARNLGRHASVSRFIFTFENHVWEKMFCAGFREVSSRAVLVGYVHSAATIIYTSYSISVAERGAVPLPDRIVTNGRRGAEILRATGFPPALLTVGGALRFPQFSHATGPQAAAPADGSPKKIVVVVSAGIDEALEIIHSAVHALGGDERFRVVLKFHPITPFSQVRNHTGELPGNFSVSEEPVGTLLSDAAACIYTSSTVAIEAYAMNIPVIHVGSEYRIDLDICAEFSGVVSVYTIEALREQVVCLTSAPGAPATNRREKIEAIFSPPDETLAQVFLG